MADTISTVYTVDIQLLDAARQDATLIKLDNPMDNLTKNQVVDAMQPALTNGWLLTNKGNVATYIGDVTLNTSIKTKLSGGDTYITPPSLLIECNNSETVFEGTFNVTNGIIQAATLEVPADFPTFAQNNVSYQVGFTNAQAKIQIIDVDSFIYNQDATYNCTCIIVIEGVSFRMPVQVRKEQS